MESLTCCNCGILFGVPDPWVKCRREDKASFYCPNGHSQSFRESTSDKLRREKESSALAFQAQINDVSHRLLVAEKERDSELRKRRKIEKRIAAGVCPCCNRTFEDLHRHMVTKHKNYALPPGAAKQIEGSVQ